MKIDVFIIILANHFLLNLFFYIDKRFHFLYENDGMEKYSKSFIFIFISFAISLILFIVLKIITSFDRVILKLKLKEKIFQLKTWQKKLIIRFF